MSSNTRPVVYRSLAQRVTTMLWGVAVAGFGVGVIAHLQGYSFDMELLGIVALTALGAWILASAIAAIIRGR
jgi:hypothetical protein